MATVGTYLNFPGTTEQAFDFYKSIFGGEFDGGVRRFSDMPPMPGMPPLDPALAAKVMHVTLGIVGGHRLMGSDACAEMGFTHKAGNNTYISLDVDSRAEADRLFAGLAADGRVEQAMQEMFWGAYWGSLVDKFGIQWMINCQAKA